MRTPFVLALLVSLAPAVAGQRPIAEDPYLWLEDVDGAAALAWVREHNETTARRLAARPEYDALYRDALAALDSRSRIPEVEPHGRYLYNFWQDAQHPRGLYRRTTLGEFRRDQPAWETVLDVDDVARREAKPWAFRGATWRRGDEHRCLIRLSGGGGDAVEVREFDLSSCRFVSGGFVVPLAKSNVTWHDANSLWVATDFGPGSLTASGYPRILKLWRRGTPLSQARTVHVADPASVGVSVHHWGQGDTSIDVVREQLTFWTSKYFRFHGDSLQPITLPPTANVVDAFGAQLLVSLKEDWYVSGTRFVAGSAVLVEPKPIGTGWPAIEVVVPSQRDLIGRSMESVPDSILFTALANVRGRLFRLHRTNTSGWQSAPIPLPDNGAVSLAGVDSDSGEAWVRYESFVVPPTLYRLAPGSTEPEPVKWQEPTFAGDGFTVKQYWAASDDCTRVPYFVVAAKTMKEDGNNPVWMFSYGGFETSLTPSYSGSYEDLHGAYGKLWLERGGVFVLANIRGGGELGPQWHTSVLKRDHYKCFEDFEAVAQDLIARRITSPSRLGIEGRSNGGLLVAATMLRRPDLYGAVVCGSPLLDMQRYHRLLAGASWVDEYGDPDKPQEWAFISRYSPYQRVRPGLKLPPIMFYTSTRDDRVHPGHARKMAAKMEALGYAVDYYENTEGGHHGSVTNEQLATRLARTYTFLWQTLGRRE